jgi:hypothetical protein
MLLYTIGSNYKGFVSVANNEEQLLKVYKQLGVFFQTSGYP